MNVIELHDISFRRDNREILQRVSWNIERGKHWALLGANGSGKTTLLKIVTGYEWPSEGAVSVLGERFGHCDLRRLRRLIGWVSSSIEHRIPPGETALSVVLSGFDASFGLYRPFTKAEQAQAEATLDILGVTSLVPQRFETLSQGEQQRVLIARALVAQPALLVLDEPCTGLDPASRADFLRDLEQFSARADSPTMILVTHHIEEIGPWLERVLVLKNGKVLASGPRRRTITSEVLTHALERDCLVEFHGETPSLTVCALPGNRAATGQAAS